MRIMKASLFRVGRICVLTRDDAHFRDSNNLVAIHFERCILHVKCPHVLHKSVVMKVTLSIGRR